MNNVRVQRAIWKFIGMAAKMVLVLEFIVISVFWLTMHGSPDYVAMTTLCLLVAAPCLILLILSRIYKAKLTRKLATIYFN